MSCHVECGAARLSGTTIMPVELGGGLAWSETLSVAGTTTGIAPAAAADGLSAMAFTVTAEINGWISIGATPDATVPAMRRRIRAGMQRSFLAPAGARVAWQPG